MQNSELLNLYEDIAKDILKNLVFDSSHENQVNQLLFISMLENALSHLADDTLDLFNKPKDEISKLNYIYKWNSLKQHESIKNIVEKEEPGIVICGKQAIDNDLNATGQMLSALLGWSQATFASELAVEGDNAIVTREVDGGLQTIKVNLPSVVTVDLRLNEPRYASLPNIMKAKKKPLDIFTAQDLGVDVSARLKITNTGEPEARAAGIKVGSVDELVEKLKEMGAV